MRTGKRAPSLLKPLAVTAAILSFVTCVLGAPIPSATLKQMGEECRERLGPALANWQEAYCACMEREVPRRLTFEEYAPLIAPGVPPQQRDSDMRYRGAMNQCVKEGEAILRDTLASLPGRSNHGPSNNWSYRPGLWKETRIRDGIIVHVPLGASADLAAKLRAMALPHIQVDHYCLSGNANPLKFFFNVTAQPPGVCIEASSHKDSMAQIIQDECILPGIVMPDRHAEMASIDRHVILTGPAKGMIDSVDAVVRVEGRSANQTMQLRWLGAECGTVEKYPN
jgi:hypothetical protein